MESERCEVWRVRSDKCEVRSDKCEVWRVRSVSERSEVWRVKCDRSVKCGE